jgi:hypothetical protein
MIRVSSKDSKAIVDWALKNESIVKYRDSILTEKSKSGHKGWENGGYIIHLEQEKVKLEWEKYNFPYENLVSIDSQIKKIYNLSEVLEFAPMGWILMYTENDYVCKWHKDPNTSEGKIHTRFNIMISKPEEGGFPIIRMADKETVIKVEENEPWVCLAGLYEHSTTEIKGNKPRIMLSFGYNIKLDEHRG